MKKLFLLLSISILSTSAFSYTLTRSCGEGQGEVVVKLAAGYDPVGNLDGQTDYLNEIYAGACAGGGGTYTYAPSMVMPGDDFEPIRIIDIRRSFRK